MKRKWNKMSVIRSRRIVKAEESLVLKDEVNYNVFKPCISVFNKYVQRITDMCLCCGTNSLWKACLCLMVGHCSMKSGGYRQKVRKCKASFSTGVMG